MKTHIIIDSASDITKAEADQLGLHYMPLKTLFGDTEYLDGITISHHEFYEKLIEGDCLPTTSQVPPYEYEEVYQKIKEAGDTAVVITLSSKLSGTYMSANIAREGYEDCIHIVDSESVCVGEQILIRHAVKLRDQGLTALEIVEELNRRKKEVCLLALLDTLEYLKRGGRISKAAAFAGGLLSIKPVITIQNGEIEILGKARGSKNGNNMLIEQVNKAGGIDFTMPLSLGYTGLDDSLLQKYIKDSTSLWEGQIDQLPISTIGSTIGTHAGPGGIAIAFFQKMN